MRKFFWLFFVATFAIAACNTSKSDNENTDNSLNISVELQNAGGQIFLLKNVKNGKLAVLDSVKANKNGKFSFKENISYEDYLILVTPDQHQFVQLIAKPGENIELNGDFSDLMHTYNVKGSPGSEIMKEINEYHLLSVGKIDSLGKIYRAKAAEGKANDIKADLDTSYRKIIENEKTYLEGVINKNDSSLSALFALYQQMGAQTPIFYPKEDLPLFEKVSKKLSARIPKSELVQQLAQLVEKTKNPPTQVGVIGSKAPEIELNNPEGKKIKLSSLQGNYVLLDFWASWCRPCRMENPNVVANYKKYHKDGFQIFQVSLDKTKEAWLKAIKDDGLDWTHVSDLKYWQSEAARLYQITGIPANFLLDKDGKIIAKNLRGSALGQKLQEIYGH